jgi:hypothetical protein
MPAKLSNTEIQVKRPSLGALHFRGERFGARYAPLCMSVAVASLTSQLHAGARHNSRQLRISSTGSIHTGPCKSGLKTEAFSLKIGPLRGAFDVKGF